MIRFNAKKTEDASRSAAKRGQRLTLVHYAGETKPSGFPFGEVVSDSGGSRTYSYDPVEMLRWLEQNQGTALPTGSPSASAEG